MRTVKFVGVFVLIAVICVVLICLLGSLGLFSLPGAEPADGLRTEPMMMARETAEIGLPGEIYTPLAMD